MTIVPLALRRDPLDLLASLAAERGAFCLDVPDLERPVTLLGCAPSAELRVGIDGSVTWTDAGPAPRDPIAAIEAFVAATPVADATLPFPVAGGAIGCFAYELGRFTVRRRTRPRPYTGTLPLAVLRRYDPLLVYDRSRAQYLLVSSDAGRRAPWLERLASPGPRIDGRIAAGPLVARWSREAYVAAAARVLDYLVAGDAYQVNLTQPFAAPLAAPAWALHAALARRHPVPYGAYLDLGTAAVVANSPELFLRRRGRRVETRPIKGTRPRGGDPIRDAALAAELERSPKDRAEHVMIVDLERNDLGRVCEAGSVTVEALARLDSHPSVHHLVSVVSGRLRSDVGLGELLRATFPGGSITGAPKARAMEIIEELEPWPREAYTGAIGLLHPGGDLELGLAIRTAVVAGGVVRYHAGGGIVVDSDPESELAEAWLKTAALRLALDEDASSEIGRRCSSG
jgi:para-aminobenzoate synthetase component 1